MVKFSRRARTDIRDIWNYTVDHWGESKPKSTLGSSRWPSIVGDPKLGRPTNHVRQGYRKYLVGAHVLFYRIQGKTILVGRILHHRMDPKRHI